MSILDRKKEISWLYSELPELIEKQVIGPETAEKLRNHYGILHGSSAKSSSYGLVFILTGILGAILIGAGIIAVFASNWESLTRPQRTILSFLPMVAAMAGYAYTFFKKPNSVAWVESTAAFLMLMVAACMGLISQTYHIDGTTGEFLFTWMLLTIPLLYLTNSTLVTMIYLGTIAWMSGELGGPPWHYWAFLAAAVPHLWMNINPQLPSTRGTLLGWTTAISVFAGSATTFFNHDEHIFVSTAGLVAVFYLLGKLFFPKGESMWKRPFQTAAIAVLYGLAIFMAFSDDSIEWREIATASHSWLILAAAVGLQIYLFTQGKKVNYFVSAFPLVALAWILFSRSQDGNFVSIFLANLYLLAYGIYYVWVGIKDHSMSLVNAGMFFISSLILVRFIDGDNFLVKGIAFIIIGIGFLGVNLYLNRKLKKETAG